jgi:hypothetical protein
MAADLLAAHRHLVALVLLPYLPLVVTVVDLPVVLVVFPVVWAEAISQPTGSALAACLRADPAVAVVAALTEAIVRSVALVVAGRYLTMEPMEATHMPAVVAVVAVATVVAAVEQAFLAAMDQPAAMAVVQQAVFPVAAVAAVMQPLGPAVMAKLKCLSGNYELRNY